MELSLHYPMHLHSVVPNSALGTLIYIYIYFFFCLTLNIPRGVLGGPHGFFVISQLFDAVDYSNYVFWVSETIIQ